MDFNSINSIISSPITLPNKDNIFRVVNILLLILFFVKRLLIKYKKR